MEKGKTHQIVLHVIIFLAINLIGKVIAESLKLPLWFDSLGTILAAYAMGPVCAAIIGATTNILYGAINVFSMYHVGSSVLIGVIAEACIKKNFLNDRFKVASLGMILAISATLVSIPVNVLFNAGMTGNLWGDSMIEYIYEQKLPSWFAILVGEFYVDLLDKVVAVYLAYWIIRLTKLIKKKRTKNDINIGILAVLIIAGMLTFNADTAYAKESEEEIDFLSYAQTVYNSMNGIPGGVVNDIAQTRDGMIWIGTYGGLYQFDGNDFIFMSEYESVKNVNCLFTDEEGRLWIGTNDNGVSICSKNEVVNVLDMSGGLPADSVKSITKNINGVYYIGTTNALSLIKLRDGVRVISIINDLTYVSCLSADDTGLVSAVTNEGGLAILKETKILDRKDANEDGALYTSAYYNEEGFLLAACTDSSIEKYAVEDGKLVLKDKYKCEGFENINAISEIQENRYLISADNGIGYLDENGHFARINTGTFDSSIDNIMVDYQGDFWFTSSRLGLLKLTESICSDIYSRISDTEVVCNSVINWNGDFYFGTDKGLVISDEDFTMPKENELSRLLEGIRIRCLYKDSRNHLWIATSGMGVFEAKSSSSCVNYTMADGLAADKTRSIIELEDKSIAVATDDGISFIKNGKIEYTIGDEEGLISSKILCLYQKDDLIYAGTDGGGVNIIKDAEVVGSITKSNGLESDIILRILESSDGEYLIIITGAGIVKVDSKQNVTSISEFPYYNNFDAIHAQDGNIWVMCAAGIYVVNEKDLLENKVSDYVLLDANKGLSQNLTANSWNYTTKEGLIYLCGDKGVVSVDTKKYVTKEQSYRMALEAVIIDGVTTHVDKEDINKIVRDAIRLEFCPKVLNYKTEDPYVGVWLEGFDKSAKIVRQSELESVVYTNLKAGEYTFHLAIYDDKKENILEEVTYNFNKESEFYDSWWFPIYIVFILILVVTYLVWLVLGSQINKTIKIHQQEFENLKLKQTADAAVAASEAKDSFLALMSHDIRTPINAIMGLNELVLRESSQQQISDYAKDIKNACGTLLTLVNSILDFSKIEEGKMDIIPVEYQTYNVINTLVTGVKTRAENKNLELQLEIDNNIPCMMFGDDVRLVQVISNLLTNAIKYTEKGHVLLKIEERSRQADTINLYVEVSDTGIGIKKEDMDKLFESFVRLDEERNRNIEGTGLGMSIVVNLLHLMGSKLDVESEYGIGSTFSFVLEQKIIDERPMGDPSAANEIGTPETKETLIFAPTASVLVVDDNEINLTVAEGLLGINAIEPDTATSGPEAIELAKGKYYDMIFLDHMMPGMDGLKTLEHLKELKLQESGTRILILTANAIAGAKEYYLGLGFDDYLSKPIEIDRLVEKLEKWLPDDKKQCCEENVKAKESVETNDTAVNSCVIGPGIDTEVGLRYCVDSWDFYIEIIKEYISSSKEAQLNELFEKKDYDAYRVIVHSVKSSSMSVGAVELSEMAKALELAARDNDVEYIENTHSDFLNAYKDILATLDSFMQKQGGEG